MFANLLQTIKGIQDFDDISVAIKTFLQSLITFIKVKKQRNERINFSLSAHIIHEKAN